MFIDKDLIAPESPLAQVLSRHRPLTAADLLMFTISVPFSCNDRLHF